MRKVFLDSNVIANWVLIKDLSEKINEFKNERVLRRRFESISFSYTLIEALLSSDRYKVETSNLAIAEVYHVIYNEIISLRLYRNGIPLTLWSKMREKQKLTEEDKYLIRETITRYIGELEKNADITYDKVDREVYPKLILEYGLRTHDAILLTTAILDRCSWFITNDREIVSLCKKKRKTRFSEIFKIVLDLPQNFLRVVK